MNGKHATMHPGDIWRVKQVKTNFDILISFRTLWSSLHVKKWKELICNFIIIIIIDILLLLQLIFYIYYIFQTTIIDIHVIIISIIIMTADCNILLQTQQVHQIKEV